MGPEQNDTRRETVPGTMDARLKEIAARVAATTPGPWLVWDGVEYAGGGRDLCIGAGPQWLANVQNRTCVRRAEHMEAMCSAEADTYICTLDGDEIDAEQQANAHFIARTREDVPFLLSVIAYLGRELETTRDELDAERESRLNG